MNDIPALNRMKLAIEKRLMHTSDPALRGNLKRIVDIIDGGIASAEKALEYDFDEPHYEAWAIVFGERMMKRTGVTEEYAREIIQRLRRGYLREGYVQVDYHGDQSRVFDLLHPVTNRRVLLGIVDSYRAHMTGVSAPRQIEYNRRRANGLAVDDYMLGDATPSPDKVGE